MLSIVLAAQFAAAVPRCAIQDPCALVERAAATFARAGSAIRSIEVRAESDIVVLEWGDTSRAVQIEQVLSRVRWRAPDRLEQRIVGYRRGPLVAEVSALTLLRQPWVIASSGTGQLRDAVRWPLGPDGADAVALHPLDRGRDSVYLFLAGDTSTLVLPSGDRVTVQRILVEPRPGFVAIHALAFRGSMDLDAATGSLVRLRGQVIHLSPRLSYWRRLAGRAVQSTLFVDLAFAPRRGGHWLPDQQRVELHAASSAVEGVGMIVRVTTRFRAHRVNPRRLRVCPKEAVDAPARCLTTAPAAGLDTVKWHTSLSEAVAAANAATVERFEVSRASTRNTDAEVDSAALESPSDTGWIDRWRQRATAIHQTVQIPGLRAGGSVRRSWANGALHGTAGVRWRGRYGGASVGIQHELIRGGSLLPMPESSDGIVAFRAGTRGELPALHDRYARTFGGPRSARVSMEWGSAQPRAAPQYAAVEPCLTGIGSAHPVIPGRNLRVASALTIGSRVTQSYGSASAGAGLRVERVDCETSRQHWNAYAAARGANTAASWYVRIDGASATRAPLPQSLGALAAPASDDMADPVLRVRRQAARIQLSGAARLGTFTTPVRSVFGVWLPSGTPSLVATLESDWRRARLQRAGHEWETTVRTDTRVALTIRPFGAGFGVGAGRSVVRDPRWRLVVVSESGG